MKQHTSSHVIINLHHLTAGTQSEAALAAGQRIFYVSSVHPRYLLGHLWQEEGFEGAWMENFRIITHWNGRMIVFEAPGFIAEKPTDLVTWALQHLLNGRHPAAIQSALDRSSAKTWALVV